MICSTLNCESKAVAVSKVSGSLYCNICALKIMAQNGPESLDALGDDIFPWEHPADGKCPNCGVSYNKYLLGLGGECPKCRVDLPEYKNKK